VTADPTPSSSAATNSGRHPFGAYGNAHASGTIGLVILERFCDEVLGWHPRMLYGEAYDQTTLAPAERP
jgi:hypothetical protein